MINDNYSINNKYINFYKRNIQNTAINFTKNNNHLLNMLIEKTIK